MQQKTILFLVLTGVYTFAQRLTSGAHSGVVPLPSVVWTQMNQHRMRMESATNDGVDSGLVSTVQLIVLAPGMANELRACSRLDGTASIMCKALVDVLDETGDVSRVQEIAGIPDGPTDPLDIATMILNALPPELRALFYLQVTAHRHCEYRDDKTGTEFTEHKSFDVQLTQLDIYERDSVFTVQDIATLAMRQDALAGAAAHNGTAHCPFEGGDSRCFCPKIKHCTNTAIRWSSELIRPTSTARYMFLFPRPNLDASYGENHRTNQPSKCRVSPYLQIRNNDRNTLRNWRLFGMIGKKFVKSPLEDGAYEYHAYARWWDPLSRRGRCYYLQTTVATDEAGKEHHRVSEEECSRETLSPAHCYGILYFVRGVEKPSDSKPYRGVAKTHGHPPKQLTNVLYSYILP